MPAAQRVHAETFKLLLQLVFGDRKADPGEVAWLMGLARDLEVPVAFREELLGYLRGARPLPPPDLGLLRLHRAGVVALASLVARADGILCPEEKKLLALVDELLDG